MYRTKYILFVQDGVKHYMLKMTARELIEFSVIDYYRNETDTGYQRPPIRPHIGKITSYLADNYPAILPTAIYAAISPVQMEIHGDEIVLHNQMRIVDGQHRIEGLKALRTAYTDDSTQNRFAELMESYELPIILIAEQPMENATYSQLEVDAFININSKGKSVRTDLARQLQERLHRITVLDKQQTISVNDEVEQTSSTRIAFTMAKDERSYWYNKIILGDEIDRKKPISITAFAKAVKPIVRMRVGKRKKAGTINSDVLKMEERKIRSCLERAWYIVQRKWPDCFAGENGFNDAYNICRGIGFFPLYGLLSEYVSDHNGDLEEGLTDFRNTIDQAQVISNDWLIGGTFTGMSSGQASKQIMKYLKNNEEIPR